MVAEIVEGEEQGEHCEIHDHNKIDGQTFSCLTKHLTWSYIDPKELSRVIALS